MEISACPVDATFYPHFSKDYPVHLEDGLDLDFLKAGIYYLKKLNRENILRLFKIVKK